MKYTSPLYNFESVETVDVMEVSIVKITYVNKAGKDENNNDIIIPTTQVTVDVSDLF